MDKEGYIFCEQCRVHLKAKPDQIYKRHLQTKRHKNNEPKHGEELSEDADDGWCQIF
jgi:hypothetical protein